MFIAYRHFLFFGGLGIRALKISTNDTWQSYVAGDPSKFHVDIYYGFGSTQKTLIQDPNY